VCLVYRKRSAACKGGTRERRRNAYYKVILMKINYSH
jgi:hypothetical protein